MTESKTDRFLPVPTDVFQIPTLAPNISGKGQVKFSLVLPTYNESENIAQIVVILAQLLDDTLLGEYE